MYFDGCSSPLTSLASTLGAPTRESTPQPVPETSTDQARRQRSGSIYRAIVFGANGSVFKVVTVRQKDGTRVSEGVLKARGVAEVSILQRVRLWKYRIKKAKLTIMDVSGCSSCAGAVASPRRSYPRATQSSPVRRGPYASRPF